MPDSCFVTALVWEFKSDPPAATQDNECLLFSTCGGYSVAWPIFRHGRFVGFGNFVGEEIVPRQDYDAWALIDGTEGLHDRCLSGEGVASA